MADRQWPAEGVYIHEEGDEEYAVEGVYLNEDQAAAPGGFQPAWANQSNQVIQVTM